MFTYQQLLEQTRERAEHNIAFTGVKTKSGKEECIRAATDYTVTDLYRLEVVEVYASNLSLYERKVGTSLPGDFTPGYILQFVLAAAIFEDLQPILAKEE